MTRRFLHNSPWSSLLDAWSEVHPRLRDTISVRDDRLRTQPRDARHQIAPQRARLALEGSRPVTPSAGAASTRLSLRPLFSSRVIGSTTRTLSCREIAKLYLPQVTASRIASPRLRGEHRPRK